MNGINSCIIPLKVVFQTTILVDPSQLVTHYETTLVQPLNVGDEDTNIFVSNGGATAVYIEIVVVYCPVDEMN